MSASVSRRKDALARPPCECRAMPGRQAGNCSVAVAWRLGARPLRSVDSGGGRPTVTRVTETSSPLPILPTSLVGSYAQPDWLIDRARLAGRFPPGYARRNCGEWTRSTSSRRMTTPRCWPSAPRRRRTRHHHRRRDAAGVVQQPLRDRPGGRRHRQPWTALDRSGHPTRCRGSPDRSCGRTPSASATWSS